MDHSEFLPSACSTVGRNKNKRKIQSNIKTSNFEEENSMLSISDISQRKDQSEISYKLEEQRQLARKSLQRASQVAGIPSKYLRPNFSQSESLVIPFNDSSCSLGDSNLLQTPKVASTPRHSLLGDSLAQISHQATDTNVSVDNLVKSFNQLMMQPNEHTFKPAEEAASMLLADEMSWRRKNEMPVQTEEFSEIYYTDRDSVGEFFKQKCNTLSDFLGGESPNVTREPVALIEPSFTLEDRIPNNPRVSLSISTIQKALESEDTPKRLMNNFCKLISNSSTTNPTFSLPVSKNSSYTSDHSDNEAMKSICNKENIDYLNLNKSPSNSRTSSRASSALTSLPNDKLPIETTQCSLSWGCIKVGKSETREFMIRNKSGKRLVLQLSLGSQEFKMRKDNRGNSEPLSSNKILLHPHESKAIIVSFIPTKIGAAIDELCFTPLDHNLMQTRKQCVKLFGYGGLFKVDFSDLMRDTTNKFWFSLGKLDDRSIIVSQFRVKNRGDLPVFLHISINSLEHSKLNVDPCFFVLSPQEQREISVSYKPSNEDYNFAHKFPLATVVDLGSLNITFGSEIDRGRLRKVCEKCVENGTKIPLVAITLIERIDDEMMPVDLVKFKEPLTHLNGLIKLLSYYQVVLTLERDPEQTIIQQYLDDSGMYQSLYQDTTIVSNKSGALQTCYVAPTIVSLTLPYKHKDIIYLKSDNEHKLNFIVNCQQPELEFKPREGILDPRGTVMIVVKFTSTSVSEKKYFKVLIIVENEIFEVEVKVDSLGYTKCKNKSLLNCML